MERKSLYCCMFCGKNVYLSREERKQINVVICPECQEKQNSTDVGGDLNEIISNISQIVSSAISGISQYKSKDKNNQNEDIDN